MNELTVVRPHGADLEAYRASTEAADLCKEIVVATSSTIQGRRYVSVEGWQAIAVAHGCAAGARDVERVDGGVRAIGEIRRMSDGQLIASAEGFVGEDEPTWYGGQSRGKTLPKRPDYAIRAMAQTRAISRACRSAFAHVVVMMKAGLATTPAEEMVAFDTSTGEILEAAPIREKVPGISKIKEHLNELMRSGNAATDLEAFNGLVTSHKDDLQKIKDANHDYWTGDGADNEGFKAWIRRRREELSIPKVTTSEESEAFAMLRETIEECTSSNELNAWFKLNSKYAETLDDDESDRLKTLYDEKENALRLLDQVTVGA